MNLPEKFIVRNICSRGMSYVFVEDAHHYIVSSIDEILLGSRRYTRESVESFIERGLWEIVEGVVVECDPNAAPSLLEKLKQLTIDTTTNIFISNGQYEVYFDAFSNPAKASSDEELEKIVDAILTLNKAVNGEDNA